ncbi:DUF3467 domain-containing protein [bacterium]|nr:DUF3467 domain-containing protein [bacterium]
MDDKVKEIKIPVKIEDDIASGTYSNFFNMFHNPGEFVFDFGRIMPGKQEFKILSRIIMNPIHAKQFLRILSDNINRFEKNFGKIPEFAKPEDILNMSGSGKPPQVH